MGVAGGRVDGTCEGRDYEFIWLTEENISIYSA
jgi:hypothetical protein